jgi:hypothetical protein
MRIAFSGAHRTGKTTLVEGLAAELPRYQAIEEPYWLLEEEGYDFSDPPSAEDFERQLARSCALALEAPARALLDRCPLDFLAYLQALDEDVELEAYAEDARDALAALDLIVFVPIEEPDRIAFASSAEDRRLRRRVDERLRALVLDDPLGLGVAAVEVWGSPDERARQVRRAMAGE